MAIVPMGANAHTQMQAHTDAGTHREAEQTNGVRSKSELAIPVGGDEVRLRRGDGRSQHEAKGTKQTTVQSIEDTLLVPSCIQETMCPCQLLNSSSVLGAVYCSQLADGKVNANSTAILYGQYGNGTNI